MRSPGRLRLSVVALVLVLTACTASDDVTTSTSDPLVTTSQASSTTTPPVPASTEATTTTIEIVSPLRPPTGEVIATGEGWELTDVEFAELVDFTARAMQRSFPDPVAVEVLGTSGITDATATGFEFLTNEQWELLRALGLVTNDHSLDVVNEIRRERLRGTCCTEDGDLLIVQVEDAGSEELTKVVIVHELVHALLTQSPPQGVVPSEAFDEPADVVSSAAEGVPQWVAMRYHAALTVAEQEAMAEELPIIRSVDLAAGVPPAAAELLGFGYVRGPVLIDGITAAGVERPYDKVVDRFPASSEQVLFPAAYVEAELPVPVSPPGLPSGVAGTASGRLGSLYLMMMAKTVVDETTALELVRAWAGDSYVQWSEGSKSCLALEIAMDDGPAAVALSDVLQTWAGERVDATVDVAGSSVSVGSCSG